MAPASAPLRLAAASVACAILAGAPLPPTVRTVGAIPLLLYLPGRCWLAAFLPAKAGGGEAQVLSAALSLALAVLLGLPLAGAGWLGHTGWMAGLLTLCLAACIIGVFTHDRQAVPNPPVAAPPIGALRMGAMVLAAALVLFAYVEASRGALHQNPDLYTDFWVVPQDGPAPSLATAGVRNQEGLDTLYAIDVVARGRVVDRGVPFILPAGAERTLSIALPSVTFAEIEPRSPWIAGGTPVTEIPSDALDRDRLELRLFKDGDRTNAYRRVWVALPPPIVPEPELVATEASAGEMSVSGSVTNRLRATRAITRPAAFGDAASPVVIGAPGTLPDDATSPLAQSQAAWRAPDSSDASRAFRAASVPDVTPGLRSPRFAPVATAPADPTPLPSE